MSKPTAATETLDRPRRPWLSHLILSAGAVVTALPFVWAFFTSLKEFGEATRVPLTFLPENPNLANYASVLDQQPYGTFYLNTVLMTLGRTAGQLLFCSLAAYVFARIAFRGRGALFALLLAVMMVPPQVLVIPQYQIMLTVGWLDTIRALIVPGMFSAFGTFLLRQFLMTIPTEIEEAAKLDGANHLQIYWHIMMPLARPGLIALTVLTVIWSWNDLLWPLVVNSSPEKFPLSVALAFLQGQYSTDFPALMAASMLAVWPLIVIFIWLQRHVVEGLAATGRKG